MRKLLVLIGLLWIFSESASADWTAGTQLLSLYAGGAIPVSRLTIDAPGAADQQIAGMSAKTGGQYLYYPLPRLAFGLDLGYTKYGDKTSSDLLLQKNTVSSLKSTVVLAVGKYGLATEGAFLPYFLGGIGLHVSTLRVDGSPSPGSTWSDTNTAESRKLTDDTQSNVALALGLGSDFPLTAHITAGLEARYLYLANSRFNPTLAGQTAGLSGIHGANHSIELLARLGLQF